MAIAFTVIAFQTYQHTLAAQVFKSCGFRALPRECGNCSKGCVYFFTASHLHYNSTSLAKFLPGYDLYMATTCILCNGFVNLHLIGASIWEYCD
jgi:hypothetical protein